MKELGFALFGAALLVGVASWFLAIWESIAMWRFSPWIFRAGIRVLDESWSLPVPAMGMGSILETKNGKFKIVSHELYLFRLRARWTGILVAMPFPIKGTIRWSGNLARVEGRIPVFTTAFLLAWVVGWTAGSVLAIVQPGGFLVGLKFLLLGWLTAGGICLISIPFEIRRARKLLDELEEQIVTIGSLTKG